MHVCAPPCAQDTGLGRVLIDAVPSRSEGDAVTLADRWSLPLLTSITATTASSAAPTTERTTASAMTVVLVPEEPGDEGEGEPGVEEAPPGTTEYGAEPGPSSAGVTELGVLDSDLEDDFGGAEGGAGGNGGTEASKDIA